jgi:hypothetical protein
MKTALHILLSAILIAIVIPLSFVQSAFAGDSENSRSMTATTALTGNVLVKVSGANSVALAGSGDEAIGRALQTVAINGSVSVLLFRPVASLSASGAITAGATVYADAAGLVTANTGGRRLGIALNATTNSGDLCDVALAPRSAGILSSQSSAAGAANTDTSEDTLFTYPMPANTLTSPNQVLKISAWGHCATTANNKTIKLYFGSEVISSGVITDSNKNWHCELKVIRTGASTQQVLGTMLHDTTNITDYSASGAETETAAITVKITGQSGTAANDILCYAMTVESSN